MIKFFVVVVVLVLNTHVSVTAVSTCMQIKVRLKSVFCHILIASVKIRYLFYYIYLSIFLSIY